MPRAVLITVHVWTLTPRPFSGGGVSHSRFVEACLLRKLFTATELERDGEDLKPSCLALALVLLTIKLPED